MEKLSSMVDMKRTPEEAAETAPGFDQPVYPYGLCISLCQDELEKLGFSHDDLQTHDMVHLHCLATVSSVSTNDNVHSGPTCRVELQITHIAAESEDEENEDEEDNEPKEKINDLGVKKNTTSKLYPSLKG